MAINTQMSFEPRNLTRRVEHSDPASDDEGGPYRLNSCTLPHRIPVPPLEPVRPSIPSRR